MGCIIEAEDEVSHIGNIIESYGEVSVGMYIIQFWDEMSGKGYHHAIIR